MYPNQYAEPTTQNPYARNLQNLKEFLRRPVVLVLTVLSTLQLLFTLISSLTGAFSVNLASYFDDIIPINPQVVQLFSTTTVVSALIGSIIPILTCVSLWIIYLKSRSDNPAATPSAGLTILYVLSIIVLSFVCLILILLLIMMLAVGSIAASSYWEGQMAVAIILLVFLVVAPIFLLLSIGQMRFTGSLRDTARSNVMKTGGSVLFGVVYLILACFGVLGFLGSLGSLSVSRYSGYSLHSAGMTFYSVITQLLSLAVLVLCAVIALSYNSYAKGKNLEYAMEQQNAAFGQTNAYAPMHPSAQAYYSQQGDPQQPQSYGVTPYPPRQNQIPTYGQSQQNPGYPAPAAPTPTDLQQPSTQQAAQPPAFQSPVTPQGAPAQQPAPPVEQPSPAAQQPETVNPPAAEQAAPHQNVVCPVCGCSIAQGDHICPQCGALI